MGKICEGKVIRSDLKERKVSKDIAKDRNAGKSFIRNYPSPTSITNRHKNEYDDDDDDDDD